MAERETQSPVVGFRNLLFRSDDPPLAYFPRLARAMEPYPCVFCSKVDADLHVHALLAVGCSLLCLLSSFNPSHLQTAVPQRSAPHTHQYELPIHQLYVPKNSPAVRY